MNPLPLCSCCRVLGEPLTVCDCCRFPWCAEHYDAHQKLRAMPWNAGKPSLIWLDHDMEQPLEDKTEMGKRRWRSDE